jgi:hypothetical protein
MQKHIVLFIVEQVKKITSSSLQHILLANYIHHCNLIAKTAVMKLTIQCPLANCNKSWGAFTARIVICLSSFTRIPDYNWNYKKYNGQIGTYCTGRLQLVQKRNYHPILCSPPHNATRFDIGGEDQDNVSNCETNHTSKTKTLVSHEKKIKNHESMKRFSLWRIRGHCATTAKWWNHRSKVVWGAGY